MQIQVLFFAAVRDRVGSPEAALDMPAGSTVAALAHRLKELHPAAAPLLAVCRFALGDTYAEPSDRLSAAEPVAVIPPVSGGSTAVVHAEIVRTPIDAAALSARVTAAGSGAILTFAGTVRADEDGDRAVVGIEYEGYETMALKVLHRIASETSQAHGVSVAVSHRLGRLVIGEISVGIAVGAAHRAAGFTALREIIERIKSDLPIWKKEEFSDGAAAWVGAQGGGKT